MLHAQEPTTRPVRCQYAVIVRNMQQHAASSQHHSDAVADDRIMVAQLAIECSSGKADAVPGMVSEGEAFWYSEAPARRAAGGQKDVLRAAQVAAMSGDGGRVERDAGAQAPSECSPLITWWPSSSSPHSGANTKHNRQESRSGSDLRSWW